MDRPARAAGYTSGKRTIRATAHLSQEAAAKRLALSPSPVGRKVWAAGFESLEEDGIRGTAQLQDKDAAAQLGYSVVTLHAYRRRYGLREARGPRHIDSPAADARFGPRRSMKVVSWRR
jgi:hypothetical protein